MNLTIFDSMEKAKSVLAQHNNVMCSISGGSDSDILIDMCTKIDTEKKIKYVFFETGLEYIATRIHLKYLEEKYQIKIYRVWAEIPIPLATLRFGQPFQSKQVSEYMSRLQKHNFKWEDKPFDELLLEYPNCKSALMWWCNQHPKKKNGAESSFNIGWNKYLKEFIMMFKPNFMISNKCCKYAKKDVAKSFKKEHNITLSITGVRKAEGGVRSTSIPNCITLPKKEKDITEYRPIFWFKNEDKELYKEKNEVKNSICYTEYGLKRTGCVGCPYGRELQFEKDVVEKYEPKMFKAINHIFKDSYEYTRLYRDFQQRMKSKEPKQMLKEENKNIIISGQLQMEL